MLFQRSTQFLVNMTVFLCYFYFDGRKRTRQKLMTFPMFVSPPPPTLWHTDVYKWNVSNNRSMPVHILTLGFSHTGLEAVEWWPGNRIIEETGTVGFFGSTRKLTEKLRILRILPGFLVVRGCWNVM